MSDTQERGTGAGGPHELHYGPLADAREEAQVRDILTQCFNFPLARWDAYAATVGLENFRRVVRERKVVAALGVLGAGQWFGGRSVPTTGIAAVGVPPEERGSGAAFQLMVEVLKEQRRGGIPLSTLYPATQRLYRKAGYQTAGVLCRHAVPGRSIGRFERELPARPVPVSEYPKLAAIYTERARATSGNLDRSAPFWARVHRPNEQPFTYAFGDEGYIVFLQESRESGYDIMVRDLVASTPRAARSIWAFLSDHSSLAREITWFGPANDPLLALLPEQDTRIAMIERWFLRLADIAQALRLRGYPAAARVLFRLTVTDEVLPENTGSYRVEVADGSAVVTGPDPASEPAARSDPAARSARSVRPDPAADSVPEIRLTVRSLAPLYTGYMKARDLAGIGWLEGDAAAIDAADVCFAGPEPWMAEGF